MRQKLPHFGTTGCLLTLVPFLLILYLISALLTCSEGGSCPDWLTSAGFRVLFIVSLALIGVAFLYALVERLAVGTPRQRWFVIGLVILFVVVFLLPQVIVSLLARH